MIRRTTLALLLAFTGCDGDHDTDDQEHEHDAVLEFAAKLGEAPAACGTTVDHDGTPIELADARLFLSDVELRDEAGEWVALALADDGKWQNGTVALLDFEDGTAGCADSGTSDLNSRVEGTVGHGTYDAVRFTVGVPFADNHAEATTAPAPLNAPGMFWTWQGGYKFVRVDFAVMTDPPSRWNVHIGSTGCESAGPTEAPAAECSKPNRATIMVEGVNPLTETIDIDLGAFVAGVDPTTNTVDTPPGCMSSPSEPGDCGTPFAALGLDFATGACVADCDGQALFR